MDKNHRQHHRPPSPPTHQQRPGRVRHGTILLGTREPSTAPANHRTRRCTRPPTPSAILYQGLPPSIMVRWHQGHHKREGTGHTAPNGTTRQAQVAILQGRGGGVAPDPPSTPTTRARPRRCATTTEARPTSRSTSTAASSGHPDRRPQHETTQQPRRSQRDQAQQPQTQPQQRPSTPQPEPEPPRPEDCHGPTPAPQPPGALTKKPGTTHGPQTPPLTQQQQRTLSQPQLIPQPAQPQPQQQQSQALQPHKRLSLLPQPQPHQPPRSLYRTLQPTGQQRAQTPHIPPISAHIP